MNKITHKTLALNVQSILEELKSTNSYYAEAKGEDFFERIAKGQHPKATLLGCSDARFKVRASNLQVEDEDDVFVIRNIGNQFIVAEGSIEYGIYHYTLHFFWLWDTLDAAQYKLQLANIDKSD